MVEQQVAVENIFDMVDSVDFDSESGIGGTDTDHDVIGTFWECRKSMSRDRETVVYLAVSMMIQAARDILYNVNHPEKIETVDVDGKPLCRSVIEDHRRMVRFSAEAMRWIQKPDTGHLPFSFCCTLLNIGNIGKARMGFLEHIRQVASIEMPNTGDTIIPKAPETTVLDFLPAPAKVITNFSQALQSKPEPLNSYWADRLKWWQPSLIPDQFTQTMFMSGRKTQSDVKTRSHAFWNRKETNMQVGSSRIIAAQSSFF